MATLLTTLRDENTGEEREILIRENNGAIEIGYAGADSLIAIELDAGIMRALTWNADGINDRVIELERDRT